MPHVPGFAESMSPDPSRVLDAVRRMLSRSFHSSRPASGIDSEATRDLAGSREPGTTRLALLEELPEPVAAGAHLAVSGGVPLP